MIGAKYFVSRQMPSSELRSLATRKITR